MWELILAHALFASSFTFGKLGLSYAPPIFFVGIRVVLIGWICMIYNYISQQSYDISFNYFGSIFQIMFFQIYLTYILAFIALPYLQSTNYALIFGLTPFFIALFSYIKGHEIITIRKVIGLLIGFTGFLLTIWLKPDNTMESLGNVSWAEVIMFFSALSWSYGWVIVNKIQSTKKPYSSTVINGITLTIGGILLLFSSFLLEEWSSNILYTMWGFWIALCGSIISTGSSYIINYWFIKKFSATFVLLMIFIDPFYVAFYGRLFLGEEVSGLYFMTLFVIMTGFYIYYKEELLNHNLG